MVFCAGLVYAERDSSSMMIELKMELEKEKTFLPKELKSMDLSLRAALDQGVKKESLKNILIDLKMKESSAKDAKKTIDVMVDLIKCGVDPKQAGNIVSQAAHQAKAEGLKGKDLAARVHEAIHLRKAEQEKLNQQIQEQKKLQKQHQEKHSSQVEVGEKFKEKERAAESHGKASTSCGGSGKGRR
jgi:hypothetical protein